MATQFLSVGTDNTIELTSEEFINDANISRDGDNLVLTTSSGDIAIIEDYFLTDAIDLVSPNGGVLSSNLINSFIEPTHAGEYADSNTTVSDVSPAGQVTNVNGDVWIMRADGSRVSAENGSLLYEGDVIETSQNSSVNMIFADNSNFEISDNARLSIDEYIYDSEAESGSSFFSMLKGAFVYTSGIIGKEDPENVNIETPVGSIGIRGTVIVGNIKPAGQTSEITVVDGAIVVSNAAGVVEMDSSFETVQLSSYDATAINIGQVDSNYLSSTYDFNSNFSSYTSSGSGTTTTHTQQQTVPTATGEAGQEAIQPSDTSTQQQDGKQGDTTIIDQQGAIPLNVNTVTDTTINTINPLVQQMINYQVQQQLEGLADNLFLLDGTNPTTSTATDSSGLLDTDSGITSPTNASPTGASGFALTGGGIDGAPVFFSVVGIGGDGSATNPFLTNQLESLGTVIGYINATDPEGLPLNFTVTNVQNLTDGVDATAMFTVLSDGRIVISNEIINLADVQNINLVLDVLTTDVAGNTTSINGINFQVNTLGGVLLSGTVGNDSSLTAIGGGVQKTVYGGAGEDNISGTDNALDALLGGTGSDLFNLNNWNFQLVDGGLLLESNVNTSTSTIANSGGVNLSGDSVLFGAGMGSTIDLTTSSGNEIKFDNIDNFLFGTNSILDIDDASVARMTDPNNVLHIWGADGGISGNYIVNLNSSFSYMGTFTDVNFVGEVIDKYIGNNGSTILVHETINNEVMVNL